LKDCFTRKTFNRFESWVRPEVAALATIAEAGLEIYELAPRKVKTGDCRLWRGSKNCCRKDGPTHVAPPEPPAPDAADALAWPSAHAQEKGRYSLGGSKRV